MEALSRTPLDDVRVHRNSSRPARFEAAAYAHGPDIHLAPGQERQLAHEAWHVVQQKQGRVPATTRLQGTAINDDKRLEREADAMGTRAQTSAGATHGPHPSYRPLEAGPHSAPPAAHFVMQRQKKWYQMLQGFGRLSKEYLAKSEVMPKGTYKYRVDTRPFKFIKQTGFMPKVIRIPMEQITQEDIQDYQINNTKNPGVVSTSDTLEGAETFAHQLGTTTPGTKYIYRVNLGGLVRFPVSANIPWYQRIFYSEQQETMVAGGIDPSRIELVDEIETTGEQPKNLFDL